MAAGASAPAAGPPAALAVPAPASALASDRIYFVMPDRYANGDPSNDTGGVTGNRAVTGFDPSSTGWFHGGDYKGLTGTCTDPVHGLARIKNLGFNAIWVTPPVVNQVSQGDSAGYHGYWGIDFTRVDPHLGTNQDFADFTVCAHNLGMKVILDVVPNHTGDIIQPSGGSTYSDLPYRDCNGKVFKPAAYVGKSTFPCLKASTMPRPPFIFPGQAQTKKPDWLNDPTNYHNRGDVDFSSCSQTCYEQGDVFGLDDLFTEKPAVVNGLAQIYSDWIVKYKLDGFRVDTARHLNAGFWRLVDPEAARGRCVGRREGLLDLRRGAGERQHRALHLRARPRAAERARLHVPRRRGRVRVRQLERGRDPPPPAGRRLLPHAGRRRAHSGDVSRQPRPGPRGVHDPPGGRRPER